MKLGIFILESFFKSQQRKTRILQVTLQVVFVSVRKTLI
jgi:hypothetical protein